MYWYTAVISAQGEAEAGLQVQVLPGQLMETLSQNKNTVNMCSAVQDPGFNLLYCKMLKKYVYIHTYIYFGG